MWALGLGQVSLGCGRLSGAVHLLSKEGSLIGLEVAEASEAALLSAPYVFPHVFYFKIYYAYLMFISARPACMYVEHICVQCLWKPEEGIRFPGIRVLGGL